MSYEDYGEASQPRISLGRERIIEILVFLLDEMRKHKQIAEIDLHPLSQRGFTQTEISTAFSWLFDKIAVTGADVNPVLLSSMPHTGGSISHSSFRVYHEAERSVLSLAAQGYLIQMRELGLVSDTDVEQVIDRVLMSGVSSVNINEVKELVSNFVFDFDDSSRMGSRMMLGSNDTIQ